MAECKVIIEPVMSECSPDMSGIGGGGVIEIPSNPTFKDAFAMWPKKPIIEKKNPYPIPITEEMEEIYQKIIKNKKRKK